MIFLFFLLKAFFTSKKFFNLKSKLEQQRHDRTTKVFFEVWHSFDTVLCWSHDTSHNSFDFVLTFNTRNQVSSLFLYSILSEKREVKDLKRKYLFFSCRLISVQLVMLKRKEVSRSRAFWGSVFQWKLLLN